MHICLITDTYPASSNSGVDSQYIADLAFGLSQEGHEITVLCRKKAPGGAALDVVQVESRSRDQLPVASSLMPSSAVYARQQLGYWNALADLHERKKIDVVEAPQSTAGALLTAITREIPAVVRMDSTPTKSDDAEFDRRLSGVLEGYVLACADAYSCTDDRISNIDSERICINSASDAAALARRQLEIYEIACRRFAQTTRPHLYRHGARRLIKSTEDMILLYDKMLYDLLFRVSYRFRLKHWLSALRANPRDFFEKLKGRLS